MRKIGECWRTAKAGDSTAEFAEGNDELRSRRRTADLAAGDGGICGGRRRTSQHSVADCTTLGGGLHDARWQTSRCSVADFTTLGGGPSRRSMMKFTTIERRRDRTALRISRKSRRFSDAGSVRQRSIAKKKTNTNDRKCTYRFLTIVDRTLEKIY